MDGQSFLEIMDWLAKTGDNGLYDGFAAEYRGSGGKGGLCGWTSLEPGWTNDSLITPAIMMMAMGHGHSWISIPLINSGNDCIYISMQYTRAHSQSCWPVPVGCPMDERCIVQDRARLVVVVVIAFKCTHNQLNLIKIAQSNVWSRCNCNPSGQQAVHLLFVYWQMFLLLLNRIITSWEYCGPIAVNCRFIINGLAIHY